MSALPAWTLLLHLAAGLALGAAYFGTLRWTSDRLASGQGLALTLLVTLGRFLVLAVALALTSRLGALPLLVTTLGVFIARAVILRRARAALA